MIRSASSKGYCTKSKVYDADHIKAVGYNCAYRPAKIVHNHCITGDSIVNVLKTTNQANIISYPGITIDKLYWKIKLGKVQLNQYKVIVIHVGTNDGM